MSDAHLHSFPGTSGHSENIQQIGEVAAFMRTTDPKMFPRDSYHVVDKASGPNAPDLETILLPLDYSSHGHSPGPPRSVVTLLAIALRRVFQP